MALRDTTAQHNAAQHSTSQHSTTQHSTAQHSTAALKHSLLAHAVCACARMPAAERRSGERSSRAISGSNRAADEHQTSSTAQQQPTCSASSMWAMLWAVCVWQPLCHSVQCGRGAAEQSGVQRPQPSQRSAACAAAIKTAAQQQPNVTAARAGPRRAAALQSPAIISHACVRVHIA